MVTGKIIAIGALVVGLIAIGAVMYHSLSHNEVDADVVYPGSELEEVYDMGRTMSSSQKDFRVVVSYHAKKLYEGTEFKVEVTDIDTGSPVVGANVSFMIPKIYHLIPEEGYIYFYAPRIQDKYLLHPNDTSRAFPLIVKKEGYYTYAKDLVVHVVR